MRKRCRTFTGRRVCGAHQTTLGSFISFNKLISRMAVDGTPSSSASSRIFLRL